VISPLPEHVRGEVAIWTNRSGQPAVSQPNNASR
jgi:hypothetical protein